MQFGGINYIIAAIVVSYAYFKFPSYENMTLFLGVCYGYLFLTGVGLLIYGYLVKEPEVLMLENCPLCKSKNVKVKINQAWNCPDCEKSGKLNYERK